MPQTDHCLSLGVGPRERRAPLPVCGTVHLTCPSNSRPPSIPSHRSILDKTKTVEVLLVTDRAIARNYLRYYNGRINTWPPRRWWQASGMRQSAPGWSSPENTAHRHQRGGRTYRAEGPLKGPPGVAVKTP
ncbi:hypothetical protein B296_00029993, partial [Ensete ventricosum]